MTNYKLFILPTVISLILFMSFKVMEKNHTDPESALPPATQASLITVSSNSTNSDGNDSNTAPQRVTPIRINGDIFFAGEQMPLMDPEVRERLDREILVNTFWHSNTILNYKLARKYFDIIEPILKKNGVPEDFKYLAIAESGLRNVVSPAGAAGIWQFMKSTAKSYDLEVYSEVDERYHLEKSTQAACEYLIEAKKKFGNWTLAAASYNMGMAGLSNKIEQQKVDSYYDLYLNSETSRYLFRIMAYKLVFENPEQFGFYIDEQDLYPPYEYEEVVVSNSINDLAQYAIDRGTTYKMLLTLNPWLRSNTLTISEGNSYKIKIPLEYVDATY